MISKLKRLCFAPTSSSLPAQSSPAKMNAKRGTKPGGAVKRCLGRLVELLYTQIIVAIFVSAFFSIYRSSKVIPSSGSLSSTTTLDHHQQQHLAPLVTTKSPLASSLTTTSKTNQQSLSQQRSVEAQLRQEALERLAREAAQFEDDDNIAKAGHGNVNANANAGNGPADHASVGSSRMFQDTINHGVEYPRQPADNRNQYGNRHHGQANNDDQQDYSNYFVQPDDFIYQNLPGEAAPIVLEKFKLIFFAQAKVGCTVWKMLFRRMMGYEDWRETAPGLIHTPKRNGLKFLYHYNLSYASHIMKAPDWTRAIFVRDPKERFLSAYLDKAVEEQLFVDTCCNRIRQVYCNVEPPPIYEFMAAIHTCPDSHWDPQSARMEPKYWPYINFVGHLETVQQDSRRLLQQLRAWEQFGMQGWGPENNAPIFATEDGRAHASNAKNKVREYLYPELEREVEEFYDPDYKSPFLNLTYARKYIADGAARTAVDHATLGRPLVEPRDWIYRKAKNYGEAAPIVVEKYKLVFFCVPHVGENELKRLFHRMMGHADWKTKKYDRKNPDAINKGLVYLSDYSLERASEMMTSPDWTRAMFVRDPKERFALAYTQTAVRRRALLHQICCMKMPRLFCVQGTTTRDLLNNVPTPLEFLEGISTCKSTIWDPITERLGALTRLGLNQAQKKAFDPNNFVKNKYWKYINFVGNMDSAQRDAKTLLERLGVWSEFGESGWADSPNEASLMGQDELFGTTSFLKEELKAKKFVQQVIKDPSMESAIEKYYQRDYRSPWFELPKKVLYASEGNTYGNVANLLLSDFQKARQESEKLVQRQW